MSIPDYQSIMLPLLQFASDNKEHAYREAVISLSDQFKLTDMERKELLPSGKQPTFDNRVGWAKTYMEKAGLFEKPRRAYFKITPRGQELLASKPKEINREVLMQFNEFIEFTQLRHNDNDEIRTSVAVTSSGQTPEEALEAAHQTLRQGLSNELLITIKQCSPEFFERLVVDLLITMGYGGSRREAGQAVGRSGDGGIDGIIKEDKLGLDTIYIQAKRWEGVVGRPEIQKFAGALQGHRARKGIFITTSNYTKDALEYVVNIETKIILIDGIKLASLMIDHNVGVTPVTTYEIKRIDSDYFLEE